VTVSLLKRTMLREFSYLVNESLNFFFRLNWEGALWLHNLSLNNFALKLFSLLKLSYWGRRNLLPCKTFMQYKWCSSASNPQTHSIPARLSNLHRMRFVPPSNQQKPLSRYSTRNDVPVFLYLQIHKSNVTRYVYTLNQKSNRPTLHRDVSIYRFQPTYFTVFALALLAYQM
jgi:hypothetical protein